MIAMDLCDVQVTRKSNCSDENQKMIISQQRFSGSMFDAEGHYVYLCAQQGVLLSSTSARWEGYALDSRCEVGHED